MSSSQFTSFAPSVIQAESKNFFRSPISSLTRPISKDKSEINFQHAVSESSLSNNGDNSANSNRNEMKEPSLNKDGRRNKHSRKNPKSNKVNINLYNQSSEEMIPQPSQLQSASSSDQVPIISDSDSQHWSLFDDDRNCPLPHYITLSAILTFFPIVTFLRLPVLLKVSVILPTSLVFVLVITVTHSSLFTCYDILSGLVNILLFPSFFFLTRSLFPSFFFLTRSLFPSFFFLTRSLFPFSCIEFFPVPGRKNFPIYSSPFNHG